MELLQTTIDKFTFRVDPSCFFNRDGVWVRVEGFRARLGLSDFLQQSSGDIAFVDVKPEGTFLNFSNEFCSVETIKVDIALHAPVTGKIIRINPALESAPEVINQDPFGEGWICEVELQDWEADRLRLLDANAYFIKMKNDADEEVKKQ
jgi:glycine cleavage system H protein